MNTEKRDLRVKADAFLEVGERLKYEYEGTYDRDSIEKFFDDMAKELTLKADSLTSPVEAVVMLRNELSKNYCSPSVGDGVLSNSGRVHDWRNYVPESIENIWGELTEKERMLVAITAELPADVEEWD